MTIDRRLSEISTLSINTDEKLHRISVGDIAWGWVHTGYIWEAVNYLQWIT